MMRLFHYVGPESIRIAARSSPAGCKIDSTTALANWWRENRDDERGWVTYTITANGDLLIAPRRSEHVACAGGGPVRAAGEMRFGHQSDVLEVTNNSTGFCPAEDCWPAVHSALEAAGLRHPGGFTFVAIFRRCPKCGGRNLVKDDWFVCALCDAELPLTWNFEL
ncbi:MAG: hypothetical protein FJ109_20525 [Deltaproteobacteria bacterium]|nr:hypothetical protein [Deltaproteobacteria bacterium]